ncbi:mannan polymerase II complex anp1 subunit-like [Mizuhopecten yessoensis]|uniref:Mannan polymerase II complex anp1 subunit n=1 Tax=Mizuhopecten yessoensis TaxID=6573 RepID=A0A210Q3A8_MIZYE|nr:mannan polymerase II complex anp1 subunit-like [Mizuhopecten yessoensis]XP_021368396.1 mannan polymerase II complex anp1 subunit-like [Mizuhopecten yessoensis]XP_021368397.1 mannan polymerase II complex anp1 subunit-like [Mizuhopecten yessoensis]OWF43195.1 Mannan polymerase II complex anp1 subunit [Mizuhopecten yessoensis]
MGMLRPEKGHKDRTRLIGLQENSFKMNFRRCKMNLVTTILVVNMFGLLMIILVNTRPRWLSNAMDGYYSREKMFSDVSVSGEYNSLKWEPAQGSVFDTMGDAREMVVRALESDKLPSIHVPFPNDIDMSKYKYTDVLNFIVPVPQVTTTDRVYKLNRTIMDSHLKLKPRKYTEKIVILTPIHNSEKSLMNFVREVNHLTYPHHLISVVFGEDSSHDGTLTVAHEVAQDLKDFGFKRTDVLHFNITGQVTGGWGDIHHILAQYKRRKHLAQARNLLLKGGLKDEDYVMWIDSDVGSMPPDLIEQLLYAEKDVVTPLCLFSSGGEDRVYDKNTWRETEDSIRNQKKLKPYELVVEGYSTTLRLYLSDLRAEGRVVRLDGVGGCSLLIKADCHRKGLKFPEEIYDHHIETEGLAKMAKNMSFGVYGLPFVLVHHS